MLRYMELEENTAGFEAKALVEYPEKTTPTSE